MNLEEVISVLGEIADNLKIIADEMQWQHKWRVEKEERAEAMAEVRAIREIFSGPFT